MGFANNIAADNLRRPVQWLICHDSIFFHAHTVRRLFAELVINRLILKNSPMNRGYSVGADHCGTVRFIARLQPDDRRFVRIALEKDAMECQSAILKTDKAIIAIAGGKRR